MVTFQEINLYNKLAKKGLVQKITCPFDESDIIITKISKDNDPIIHCISCDSSFDLGINTQKRIKDSVDNFKHKRNI
jgi:transcription elongation factor Elf1